MVVRALTTPLAVGLLLFASAARADRVAVLPLRGDAAAVSELTGALASLGHTLVPAAEVASAIKARVVDGVADTQEEYRAVGGATRADWVLAGSVEPAVTTERVELTACLVKLGRVESVARELERAERRSQIGEMLVVLVRPEGIGAGALPWERGVPGKASPSAPTAPLPALKPTVPPVEGRARIAYLAGRGGEVWPPYTGGKRGFVALRSGFSLAALSPPLPAGVTPVKTSIGGSWTGAVRAGWAVTDLGFEPFAELGGNLAGPAALWAAAGARWMFAPAVSRGSDGVLGGAPFYLGPELLVGGFFRVGKSALGSDLTSYSASGSAQPLIGVAVAVAYAVAPALQLEASLGDLRWVPGSGGSLLTVGATFGAALRF